MSDNIAFGTAPALILFLWSLQTAPRFGWIASLALAARVSPDVAAASDGMAFYRKRGCPRCNQTGYRGRIGIYQLLEMTEDLASLASRHASREEIERAAMDTGMKTLWDDGIAKVAAGLTSIEELARVSI